MESISKNPQIAERCGKLHGLCNSAIKFYFPLDFNKLPLNGIYVMFQKNEQAHDGERIVRVGTHTGQNQLQSRIKQHFLKENKDRSIFRKNIGRCLLKIRNDAYFDIWDLDSTTKDSKAANAGIRDLAFEQALENEITAYIQENFHFCVIKAEEKEIRLEIESRIASTVSLCGVCAPSKQWLGLFSPKERIRESGLWQVNELYKEPLSDCDLEYISKNLLY